MRNIKLTIEYDGKNYAGWQVQNIRKSRAASRKVRTIQETMEKAIQKILHGRIRLIVSGRTDAGVHAFGQVANFKTDSGISVKKLSLALNAVLPDDISVIKEISAATGTFGMIGGQIVDIEEQRAKSKGQRAELDIPTIEYVDTHKTGALIAISCKTGAIIAKASVKQTEAIFRYGEYIGFAFQIIDDILDNEGLARIFGKQEARKKAQALVNKAKEQLSIFNKSREPLLKLADFVIERKI